MLSGPRRLRRTAVLISGGGSTLQSLLEMQHLLEISLVVSNKRKNTGLLKAKRFGKPVWFMGKEQNFADLSEILKKNRIERIFLAGFMKILPPEFVEAWRDQIYNIHPSLLPEFPGLNAAEVSWQKNAAMGCTIHKVTELMDAGPIVLQQTSKSAEEKLSLLESILLLRRSEQHLLRTWSMEYCI